MIPLRETPRANTLLWKAAPRHLTEPGRLRHNMLTKGSVVDAVLCSYVLPASPRRWRSLHLLVLTLSALFWLELPGTLAGKFLFSHLSTFLCPKPRSWPVWPEPTPTQAPQLLLLLSLQNGCQIASPWCIVLATDPSYEVYSFPRAAFTKYHKLGGLQQLGIYCLTVLEGSTQKNDSIGRALLPLTSRGQSFLASSWLQVVCWWPWAILGLQLPHSHLYLCHHMRLSLWVSVLAWPPSYKSTGHIGLGTHPTSAFPHLNRLCLHWPYFRIRSLSKVLGVRTFMYLGGWSGWGGDTVQHITWSCSWLASPILPVTPLRRACTAVGDGLQFESDPGMPLLKDPGRLWQDLR